MRLGQLARKLDLKTEQLVSFLATRQIAIEAGNNTKLLPDHVVLIMEAFAPDTQLTSAELQEEEVEQVTPEVISSTVSTPSQEEWTAPESTLEELPEVIRAPKVELAGLKVLGKIELPEKKKKETEVQGEEEKQEVVRPQRPERRPRREDRRKERSGQNPIARQREQEKQEEVRKREEEREREKQRKKDYYYSRVKSVGPTRPARIYREETEEGPAIPKEAPRTLWGKFMKWLNT